MALGYVFEVNRALNETHYRDTYGITGRGHYLTADHKKALNRCFGIPVIIITAVVGTTIFGTLNESPDPGWRIAAGLISLTGTILSSLQTSLGFAQDAEKHKAAGETYRAIRRSFDLFTLKYSTAAEDQRQAAYTDLERLIDKLKELPAAFPSLPDKFYDKAVSEHRADLARDTRQSFPVDARS